MKGIKKGLAILLVLCTLLSMVVMTGAGTADASQDAQPLAASADDGFYKIVHLDCGRKYFTKDWIIALINEMSAAGYNQLELAFGNDGLRFLLDDMTFEVNGKTYDHDTVVSKVEQGNIDQNSSGDKSWLTQTEMDEIIAAAKAKNIQIVPLLNLPGHANAILDIFDDQYNASGSQNTFEVTNTEGLEAATAIFKKYVDYFADWGCTFFNFGADEYANDASSGSFSFSRLNAAGYQSFVDFINELADYIVGKGMTPRAFNDGLYYNGKTNTIATAIQCCYWSSGWSGYNVASASTISGKGHAMINTHGNYYYVLNTDGTIQDPASTALNFSNTSFMGSTISNPAGSMFCIWCDNPNGATEQEIAADVRMTLRMMAARMNNTTGYSGEGVIVSGGFNADGTINGGASVPDPTPGTADKTIPLTAGEIWTETQSNVNNSGNVDESKLDKTIATVKVTGEDEVEEPDTYESVSVTCNNLINGNSGSWKETGYYYKSGDNYYPLYATRSSKNNVIYTSYTYTWGYKDGDNFIEIGNQTAGSLFSDGTQATPNITVYRQDPGQSTPASTTITFTGVAPGTTYVTVGDTTYEIVVEYKTQTVNVIVGNTTTIPVSGAADTSELDTGIATVSISGNTMTVTGVAEGQTTVTVGDTIYTINVTEEDLNAAPSLTVDFWITNSPVDTDLNEKTETNTSGNVTRRYYEYPATTEGVYSETGILFSDLVPANGTRDGNEMAFWKGTRLASDNKQTGDNGVDKTTSGTDFTYIRYWNGSWAYSADGESWINVVSGDQIVAYYLQVTEVTDEVTTQVVDWGPQKNDWSGLNYLKTEYVLVDYTVKYESGEETPSSYPTADSLGFHCQGGTTQNGYYYRTLGMVRAVETADYEVYMITLTPTSDNPTTTLASTAAGNTSYSYKGTEVVAWAATQEDLDKSGLGTYTSISGKFTYSVGGEPIVSGLEIYRQHGMKVTYYVRAKVTEDSLAVHYIDQTANNQEFYNYNIAVKAGTTFDQNIGLQNGSVIHGSVTNLQDKTQTVSADLKTMPAIGVQYRYSDYTCVKVERSADGKDVYLYYTFNNAHSFVVDFGLPVEIEASKISTSLPNLNNASVSGAEFGTAVINGGKLIYTPTKILTGVESLTLTITEDGNTASHQIYIYPATTVYYEEGFATYSENVMGGTNKGTTNQTTSAVGAGKDGANYGYDSAYNAVDDSNGTTAVLYDGSTGTFTFTGTGVDVYARCTPETGKVIVAVYKQNEDGTETFTNFLQVNTVMKDGTTAATKEQAVTAYNVPIVSLKNLDYGTYRVKLQGALTRDESNTKVNWPVYIDGFRVHGTLDVNSDVYSQDNEANPQYAELREAVLAGLQVDTTKGQYADQIAANAMSQVYKRDEAGNGAVVFTKEQPGSTVDNYDVQDLLDNGPKNEFYLFPNQTVVFKIKDGYTNPQIGLKALDKATTYTITGEVGDQSLSTSTDMFYPLTLADNRVVTITNTGKGILSITEIKAFAGVANGQAMFAALSEADLMPALLSMGFESEPVPATATLNITIQCGDKAIPVTLTAEGMSNETHTFTAAEIKAAVEQALPEGYTVADVTFSDVTVACGEASEVSFTAAEVPAPVGLFQKIVQTAVKIVKKIFSWF